MDQIREIFDVAWDWIPKVAVLGTAVIFAPLLVPFVLFCVSGGFMLLAPVVVLGAIAYVAYQYAGFGQPHRKRFEKKRLPKTQEDWRCEAFIRKRLARPGLIDREHKLVAKAPPPFPSKAPPSPLEEEKREATWQPTLREAPVKEPIRQPRLREAPVKEPAREEAQFKTVLEEHEEEAAAAAAEGFPPKLHELVKKPLPTATYSGELQKGRMHTDSLDEFVREEIESLKEVIGIPASYEAEERPLFDELRDITHSIGMEEPHVGTTGKADEVEEAVKLVEKIRIQVGV